jgi:hypothetical protein
VNLVAGRHRLKLKTEGACDLREDSAVHLAFAPTAAHLFDRTSGERLN